MDKVAEKSFVGLMAMQVLGAAGVSIATHLALSKFINNSTFSSRVLTQAVQMTAGPALLLALSIPSKSIEVRQAGAFSAILVGFGVGLCGHVFEAGRGDYAAAFGSGVSFVTLALIFLDLDNRVN